MSCSLYASSVRRQLYFPPILGKHYGSTIHKKCKSRASPFLGSVRSRLLASWPHETMDQSELTNARASLGLQRPICDAVFSLLLAKRYVERFISSSRRECLDHMIVFCEAHLRRILGAYAAYYNEARTHSSLNNDAPFQRAVQRLGAITSQPVLGGLHHRYCRI